MNSGTTAPTETKEQSVEAEQSVSAPPLQEDVQRELTYEEYDPKGTLALILVYFLILLVMWFFMYFVEFLGNDLVVVG